MTTFVLGDLHGGLPALNQVLERCGFDYKDDQLILLGDLVDGWPDTKGCIDLLLQVKNLVFVRGNHDQWFVDYLRTGQKPAIWTSQGGAATLKSYEGSSVPRSHEEFFRKSVDYYVDPENRLFVHGGFDPAFAIELQKPSTLMWDRSLVNVAWESWRFHKAVEWKRYKEIYVGHTPVTVYNFTVPTWFGNLCCMDTGGGWEWKLSILEVNSGLFWQSDKVDTLYPPGTHGR